MKTLNKFMVNKVAELFELSMSGEWLKFYLLYVYNSIYGSDWDKAEPNGETADIILGDFLLKLVGDAEEG